MKLLIIADDFTGALDTGVQLSKNNISTYVIVDSKHIPTPFPECEVGVINANIRHQKPISAFECIQDILKKLYFDGLNIYLKTDSVFRGNISAAFKAAIDYIKKPLFFVPAYPALGRTTKGSAAFVNGELLENSVFADDPRTPATQSNIPSIINKDYNINVECLTLNNYKSLNKEDIQNDNVYLFDCENDEQLQSIGNKIDSLDGYSFCAGCAGFAETFIYHINLTKSDCLINNDKNNRPSLFISGSANAVTFEQLQFAKENDYPVFCLSNQLSSYINSYAENISFKDACDSFCFQNQVESACLFLNDNKPVILATATGKNELLNFEDLHENGKNDEQIHNCIAEYTSNLVKSILETAPLINIVVFGGDMVAAILQKLGIYEVKAGGEIIAGVPLCYISKNNTTINLVTKSGGFGSKDLIPVIQNYFRKD